MKLDNGEDLPLWRKRLVRVILTLFCALAIMGVGSIVTDAVSDATVIYNPPPVARLQADPEPIEPIVWTAPPVRREPEYGNLPDRAVAFMRSRPGGRGRMDEEAWFREMAVLAHDVTRGSEITPELVLAVAFRESSWDPTAVGEAGEISLMQLLGPAVRYGYAKSAAERSPSLNLWLGVRRLEAAMERCDTQVSALLHYASGSCIGPQNLEKRENATLSAIRVISWARMIKNGR